MSHSSILWLKKARLLEARSITCAFTGAQTCIQVQVHSRAPETVAWPPAFRGGLSRPCLGRHLLRGPGKGCFLHLRLVLRCILLEVSQPFSHITVQGNNLKNLGTCPVSFHLPANHPVIFMQPHEPKRTETNRNETKGKIRSTCNTCGQEHSPH